MSQDHSYEGGCLCGAIRYRATEEPLHVAHCHCESCRRSTGAAFATGVFFPVEAVSWEQDESFSYRSSESFARLFCSHCGSSVAQHNLTTGTMWVLAGTLDHPESVKLEDGLPRHFTFAPMRHGKKGGEPTSSNFN